ncbi:MAG: polysaccharide export protein [Pyrinomonadaceae bacterium]|nr:polysaccharide export protein [Pyrinomonadaceae bacterium]
MKSLNKFLTAAFLALAVSGGVEVYAQTPSQSPSSSLPVPAVDVMKTRQRVVTKTSEPEAQDAPKNVDVSSDVLLTPDEPPAKPATAKKPELTAPAKSVSTGGSNQPVTTDAAQPKAAVNTSSPVKDAPSAAQDNRHEQASEEAAIVPYYNNFFNTYRLGPEDIISVNVFGQDRYSRSAIIVPPSGRISLALIPGGIFVNGKTVEEVAEAITKRYDEYIIEPQVSVSLDKASSYRYSVVGDVAQPGIRLMNRRLTVTEALSEAGGVLSTGNRSKVVVLRRQANGNLEPIAVNVSAIYKGKAPDITYLVPGDQILVPGNRLKSFQKIMTFFPVLNFARIFTGGIF